MQLGFDLFAGEDEAPEKEDARAVMKELLVTCSDCRLSEVHPQNRGMIYRGDVNAKIGVIGIAPGAKETENGSAMVGASGAEFEKWMNYIGINTRKDIFITNIVQCMPPIKKISGKMKQRDPDKEEISACFGPRCLRVLRAMPNLEVIISLGWLTAKAFLGTSGGDAEPKSKTHQGGWFESSLLPGIPIYCMSHPAELLHSDSDDKRMTIQHCLDQFKREYLQSGKVKKLAIEAKEQREALGLGMF